MLVREGLVMIADTRTNAGIDNISTYRKLHMFNEPDRHVMMIASAGNLSATQSILYLVSEGFDNPETKERERITDCKSMFDAAQLIGRAIRRVQAIEGEAYQQGSVKFEVSFLFGGQIAGDRMRLFMIYSAGNFIECSQDAPYFQIGEYKYGKPVLDRAVNFETNLDDALKVALVAAHKKGSDVIVYPEAQHGFHADYRETYNQAAAIDGWQRMLDHFAKNGVKPRTPKK